MWYALLPKILNMSLTGSVVILAVLVARLLLRRAPKVFSYALWAAVLFRLLCPVSFASDFSVFNFSKDSPQLSAVEYFQYNGKAEKPMLEFDTGRLPVTGTANDTDTMDVNPEGSELRTPNIYLPVALTVWLCGAAAMLGYSAVSYFRLRRRLVGTVRLRENIYLADGVSSPFVMGLVRPNIYLPSTLSDEEQVYIILHEQHHICRCDHVVKILSFAALCVHWFNPLVWLAFVLSGKDMEMSCDEAVMRSMDRDIRADYSASLLSLATGRRILSGTPLAFGEGDTGGRIKNVLRYKKPAFWVIAVVAVICVTVAVCLVTNPKVGREFPMTVSNLSDLDPEQITSHTAAIAGVGDGSNLNVSAEQFDLRLTSDFDFEDICVMRFFYMQNNQPLNAQLHFSPDGDKFFVTESTTWPEQERVFKLQHYLEALKYLPQAQVRQLSPEADRYLIVFRDGGTPEDYDRVITYSSNGECAIDGWFIHLELQPLHASGDDAYHGTGDEVIQLFYGNAETDSSGSINETIAALLETICSSPEASSNPGDFIKAHQTEFDTLVDYGEQALRYCFGEFLQGGQTDLRGQIMMSVCQTILPALGEKEEPLENVVLTGQDWFDGFRSYADVLKRNNSAEDLEKYYPATWLLLQMAAE